MKRHTFALHCIAPDGEHITERRDFPTLADAWQCNDDMGSRWFFYPIPVVTTSAPAATIRDVPHGVSREWIGRRLATFARAIAAHPVEVAAMLAGNAPLCVFP